MSGSGKLDDHFNRLTDPQQQRTYDNMEILAYRKGSNTGDDPITPANAFAHTNIHLYNPDATPEIDKAVDNQLKRETSGEINQWQDGERVHIQEAGKAAPAPEPRKGSVIDAIRPGDKVTILDRFGKTHIGRAVMRSSEGGWVLNMGGAHGTPGLANVNNIVKVSPRAGAKPNILGTPSAPREVWQETYEERKRGMAEVFKHADIDPGAYMAGWYATVQDAIKDGKPVPADVMRSYRAVEKAREIGGPDFTVQDYKKAQRLTVNRPKVAERRYPTDSERTEMAELYRTARIAGKESRYDRMIWATDEFVKAHPEWTKASAYKSVEESISHGIIGTPVYKPDTRTRRAAAPKFKRPPVSAGGNGHKKKTSRTPSQSRYGPYFKRGGRLSKHKV